ncbi:VanZ family protein [Hathewaya histolytica]|uniref:VanZ family protein n=1 Tax=Hathewaya histolytica TaxID=1498 RepID=A0A4U9RR24_HATHI|nr:VanZ family protein [Hathewaya histolytica]VTQ94715.1 VanZ family protein [Hathewaya histolytica]
MENKKLDKLVYFTPSFIWMGIIFYFSHQVGDVSSKNNHFIVSYVDKISSSLVKFIGYDNLNVLVRKSAHVTEYLILFLLLFYGFYRFYKNTRYKCLWKSSVLSALSTILYACTDEFHQIFVIGREGKIFDVFVDSIGALIGIIIVTILFRKKNG